MEIVFGDYSLGIRNSDVSYIFAYNLGGLDSLNKGGKEFFYRVPSLAFWRATTDNDRGNGFSRRSCMWMGADLFFNVDDFSAVIDGKMLTQSDLRAPGNNMFFDSPLRHAEEASITFFLSTCTSPSAKVCVKYSVSGKSDGIRVDYTYTGCEGLPEFPLCGMRFILPFRTESFDWRGLSGETYPDRMDGGVKGTWHSEGIPECPYVMAQDYGMHMNTESLTVKSTDGESLTVESLPDSTFNFSLLAWTPQELEAAYHPIDLPLKRRSYLTIAAAVRGVGGIDSWGSDVSPAFRLDASKEYRISFILK